jgi:hypothetical protein
VEDIMKIMWAQATRVCGECSRVFDMFDETDAEEWHYGHDCEAVMTECPNHGGAFDCTPFCELCAGEQEVSA